MGRSNQWLWWVVGHGESEDNQGVNALILRGAGAAGGSIESWATPFGKDLLCARGIAAPKAPDAESKAHGRVGPWQVERRPEIVAMQGSADDRTARTWRLAGSHRLCHCLVDAELSLSWQKEIALCNDLKSVFLHISVRLFLSIIPPGPRQRCHVIAWAVISITRSAW